MLHSAGKVGITVIADSTLDNKAWVRPGGKSVIEHLRSLLSHHYEIHDYSNDGFTTTDCLNGALKNKVFSEGQHADLYPPQPFCPLKEAEASIKKSQYVVLSVGGNNFREFLPFVSSTQDKDTIQAKFNEVLKKMQVECIQILQKIYEYNPQARIILMTQYYPCTTQRTYNVYAAMGILGRSVSTLNNGKDPVDSEDVIHMMTQQVYADIFAFIRDHHYPVVVVDAASSLDPHQDENYVSQIEPSNIGGMKIARMLRHAILVLSHEQAEGMVYRFLPEFFKRLSDIFVQKSALKDWMPQHPRLVTVASNDLIEFVKIAMENPGNRSNAIKKFYDYLPSDPEELKNWDADIDNKLNQYGKFSDAEKNAAKAIMQTAVSIKLAPNKEKKQQALIGRLALLSDLGHINLVFDCFKNFKDLNTHRNPCLDWLLGLHNTKSWRNAMRIIRNVAFDRLDRVLKETQDKNHRLILLQEARQLSIFNYHRNNSIFFGAFGRTKTVQKIDRQIKKIRKP